MANKVRYLHHDTKTGDYYARLRVPSKVAHLFEKTHIKRSLHTGDRRTALDRLPAVVATIKAEFNTRGAQPTQMPWSGMTGAEWLALSPDDRDARIDDFTDRLDRTAHSNPAAASKMYREFANATLPTKGLPSDVTALIAEAHQIYGLLKQTHPDLVASMSFEKLFEYTHNVKLSDVAKHKLDQASFDYFVPDHMLSSLRQRGYQPKLSMTLSELIKAFQEDHRRQDLAPATARAYHRAIKVLLDALGAEKSVKDIKRSDIEVVVKTMRYMPKNAEADPRFTGSFRDISALVEGEIKKTLEDGDDIQVTLLNERAINKYLGNIQTIFKWGYEQQHLDANPAMGIKLQNVPSTEKRRFTKSELHRVFHAKYDCRSKNWIPLIALYQGMRGNEISQLLVRDIVVDDGVSCIRVMVEDVTDRRTHIGDGRTLKNIQSRRSLPIHRDIIELGFDQYVKSRVAIGEEYLFDVKKCKNGTHYDSVRDELKEMIVESGVYIQGETSFHSFRHNFVRALRDSGVPQDHRKALGGWSKGLGGDLDYRKSAEEGYGQGFSPKTLKASLDAIAFDLPLLWQMQSEGNSK